MKSMYVEEITAGIHVTLGGALIGRYLPESAQVARMLTNIQASVEVSARPNGSVGGGLVTVNRRHPLCSE